MFRVMCCPTFFLGLIIATLAHAQTATPDEARAIAKEAYIYGFPLVDNYRIIYAYNVDKTNPEYKAPFNEIQNTARAYTPDDKAIQTPNSDTPYSSVAADLRTEPIVLTLPAIKKNRYYSVQMIDLYTFNFDYLGTRTTGNDGGDFLVAGPNWKGETPKGIKKVLRSETEFDLLAYRTQLFNPADLENVKKIQAGYKVQPLSDFLGQPAPPAAPPIDFIKPLSPQEQRTSLAFFSILNFTLQFCPTHPSETELRARFAKIGIEPGKTIDLASLSPEMQAALKAGMEDGQKEIEALIARTSGWGELFGTREFLNNDYVKRAAAAQAGIYGNAKEEAFYIQLARDADGVPLDAGTSRYILRFEPGKLPPASAFWSVTMYDLPDSLLVANTVKRYLINSPMLPNLEMDEDGGLTIYMQSGSPGADKEANWLPAPKGPFRPVIRMYLPKPEVLTGAWKAPTVQRVK